MPGLLRFPATSVNEKTNGTWSARHLDSARAPR
jgi:hypothetical protein